MIVSTHIHHIRQCIKLAETYRLSNDEEAQLTIEMVRYFKKLNTCLLTQKERKHMAQLKRFSYAQCLTIMRYLNHSRYRLTPKELVFFISWMPVRAYPLVIALWIWPNALFKSWFIQPLNKRLIQLFVSGPFRNRHTIIYFDSKISRSKQHVLDYMRYVEKDVKDWSYKIVVLPSKCLVAMDYCVSIQSITRLNQRLGSKACVIIDVLSDHHFSELLPMFEHLATNTSYRFGIGIHCSNKWSLQSIIQFLQTLPPDASSRLTIRIHKGHDWAYQQFSNYIGASTIHYSENQLKKMNIVFKWTVYSLLNLVKQHQFNCIIATDNMFDVSWTIIQRTQMHVESLVQVETNSQKVPNISKFLHIITENSMSGVTVLPKNSPLPFVLERILMALRTPMVHQLHGTDSTALFVYSHKLFFKYLQRHYFDSYMRFKPAPANRMNGIPDCTAMDIFSDSSFHASDKQIMCHWLRQHGIKNIRSISSLNRAHLLSPMLLVHTNNYSIMNQMPYHHYDGVLINIRDHQMLGHAFREYHAQNKALSNHIQRFFSDDSYIMCCHTTHLTPVLYSAFVFSINLNGLPSKFKKKYAHRLCYVQHNPHQSPIHWASHDIDIMNQLLTALKITTLIFDTTCSGQYIGDIWQLRKNTHYLTIPTRYFCR